MNISSINPLGASALARVDAPLPKINLGGMQPGGVAPTEGFGQMLDGVVATVDAKQDAAQAATRQILLGDSEHLHQSVIAMQEASVAFTMMVEMRNKLVEGYQELMRMQV
ncbi:MAG: flagellar hook-basal body complex protein FliE [Verrucomicrobiota bacterium]